MSIDDLGPVSIKRKSGQEPFRLGNEALEHSLLDFWQWATSNLLVNTTRGVLAEYIVALDLGVADGIREVWDAFDLLLPDGIKIEVKSGAYLQSWRQTALSRVVFSISPARQFDDSLNDYGVEYVRSADVYVFAVLNHKDKQAIDPLNLAQWEFYVLLTRILDEKYPTQKTIGLSSLLALKPIIAHFGEIRKAVYKALVG